MPEICRHEAIPSLQQTLELVLLLKIYQKYQMLLKENIKALVK